MTDLRCSFCAKLVAEVEHLIQGRTGNICARCVEVCWGLLAEYRASRASQAGIPKARPAERRT